MSNPFIQKAQEKKARQCEIIAGHVRELEKICEYFKSQPDDDPTKLRVNTRLREAREAAQIVEQQ